MSPLDWGCWIVFLKVILARRIHILNKNTNLVKVITYLECVKSDFIPTESQCADQSDTHQEKVTSLRLYNQINGTASI